MNIWTCSLLGAAISERHLQIRFLSKGIEYTTSSFFRILVLTRRCFPIAKMGYEVPRSQYKPPLASFLSMSLASIA